MVVKEMSDMREIEIAIVDAANEEHKRTCGKYERYFSDHHHGAAILKEEIDELSDAVRKINEAFEYLWQKIKQDKADDCIMSEIRIIRGLATNAACEAVQVLAMCEKYAASIDEWSEEDEEYPEDYKWNGKPLHTLHRELWKWLADNPDKCKWQAPIFDYESCENTCFACEYAKRRCPWNDEEHKDCDYTYCDYCPIEINCIDVNSLFSKWTEAKRRMRIHSNAGEETKEERKRVSELANQIAEMPWEY